MRHAIVELRQYTLHPGKRDTLVELFDRCFIEPQEAAGMTVLGQFRDLDDPDRFVWLRSFADMGARKSALTGFYSGDVWQANKSAANATMLDSDNVLLLRPARGISDFEHMPASRPHSGETAPAGAYAAGFHAFRAPVSERTVGEFANRIVPGIANAGGSVTALLVTEASRNDYPALPVREGENVLVWLARFSGSASLDAVRWPDVRDAAGLGSPDAAGFELRRLAPTPRSLLR